MKKALVTALFVLCIAPFFITCASAEELASNAADLTGVREAESDVPDDVRDISGAIAPNGTYDAAGALDIKLTDQDIAALEEKIVKLDKEMEANATNSVKLREIMEERIRARWHWMKKWTDGYTLQILQKK